MSRTGSRSLLATHAGDGPGSPALAGWYVYGDFCSGWLWGATDASGSWSSALLLQTGMLISSFGEDESGNVYLVDYSGAVHRIDSCVGKGGIDRRGMVAGKRSQHSRAPCFFPGSALASSMTKPYRLPAHVKPTHYALHLTARVGASRFEGSERIHLRVTQATDRIEIHLRDIDISKASIGADVGRVEPDAEREMAALVFAQPIPAGDAMLDIAFTGKVSANMEGLYLSKDGAEECLSTQCEETDARGIFPCFDEPAFKARFEVTVTTTSESTVLANGPLLKAEAEQDGMRTWRFAPTKPMSSYLFALVIGKLASTPETVVRGVPMRVWAMEGKESLGAYGNAFAAKLLPWFEDYFGARYHFDKYDQVAVPSFSAGAMENSGLVIFRQSLLLRDPKTTPWSQEKLIARVIAHEFAHQWFGNLVTMAWWDDIWLNESFAEWMAHKAADAVGPEYVFWADFQDNKREALVTDALETTHAIYTHVETPEEATELFDTVTYSKGSVLMRMIERYLGEDAFRAGLRTYMQEFAEKNAKGDDLWRHLAQSSGKPVTALAQSWILQPGYPVVSASLDSGTLRVAQRRFFSKPDAPANTQTWAIPLVVRFEDDAGVHERRELFDQKERAIELEARGEIRWLHLNGDGVGFYRQDLSHELRAKLAANVGSLSAAEQRDLLDDAWALARAKLAPVTGFLDLLGPVVASAKDHHVLGQAVGSLERVEEMLFSTKEEKALAQFRVWTRALLSDESARLGSAPKTGDTRDESERRAHVLRAMARHARDVAALDAATRLADAEIADPTRVDPTLAGPAVSIAARFGDAARHDLHLATYERRRAAGAPPALVQRHMQSLAVFEDPKLVAKTLTLLRDGRFPQEALGPMLRLMLTEPRAQLAAWDWMKENWKDVREKVGDMWTGFLVEHTGRLPASLEPDIRRFFDANLHGVAQQSYARAIEALEARAEFERRATPEMAAWMLKR